MPRPCSPSSSQGPVHSLFSPSPQDTQPHTRTYPGSPPIRVPCEVHPGLSLVVGVAIAVGFVPSPPHPGLLPGEEAWPGFSGGHLMFSNKGFILCLVGLS